MGEKMSRRKIAYDLNISPYKFTAYYMEAPCNLTFVFSSELYKNNFGSRLIDNRKSINQSLSNRFGFKIECDLIADLKLYTTIEKRGFLICKDGDKIECLNDIILAGVNLITKR